MRRGGEEMLDEIAFFFLGRSFACRHPDHALAAAPLGSKRTDGGALDETAVGDADDAAFVGDEILHVDLALVRNQLRQAGAAVLVANVAQLFLDDLKDARFLGQNVAQVLDRIDQLLVFARDLFAFETGQLIKAEIENLIRLMFAEGITTIDQAGFVPDQDPDLLDLFPGEFEREQFHPRFVAVG